jgi:hypothetical protein
MRNKVGPEIIVSYRKNIIKKLRKENTDTNLSNKHLRAITRLIEDFPKTYKKSLKPEFLKKYEQILSLIDKFAIAVGKINVPDEIYDAYRDKFLKKEISKKKRISITEHTKNELIIFSEDFCSANKNFDIIIQNLLEKFRACTVEISSLKAEIPSTPRKRQPAKARPEFKEGVTVVEKLPEFKEGVTLVSKKGN